MSLFVPDEKILSLKKFIAENAFVWQSGREAGRKGEDSIQSWENCCKQFFFSHKDQQSAELFALGYIRGYEERKAALEPWLQKSREEALKYISERFDPRLALYFDQMKTVLEMVEDRPDVFWPEMADQLNSYD